MPSMPEPLLEQGSDVEHLVVLENGMDPKQEASYESKVVSKKPKVVVNRHTSIDHAPERKGTKDSQQDAHLQHRGITHSAADSSQEG